VPCMWKRLAGRPTGDSESDSESDPRRLVQAQVHPPAGAACKVPSFGIGRSRSLAPWIIRTRYGPQPEEKAACALQVPL
jgi:hypothetical protein